MSVLSMAQLHKLFLRFRIHETTNYPEYYNVTGEEAFIHYMYRNWCRDTKLKMSRNMSGGDPIRVTYSIQLITDNLYNTFYHKISGDSTMMWILDTFQYII